jgi:hypothetical protein
VCIPSTQLQSRKDVTFFIYETIMEEERRVLEQTSFNMFSATPPVPLIENTISTGLNKPPTPNLFPNEKTEVSYCRSCSSSSSFCSRPGLLTVRGQKRHQFPSLKISPSKKCKCRSQWARCLSPSV